MAWGLSSCARSLASAASRAGAKARARACCRSGARGLGKPLSPGRGQRHAQVWSGFFIGGSTRAYLMGITPEPLDDPDGRSGSSFSQEPLIPSLNIPIC
jgi:hypothetical protein